MQLCYFEGILAAMIKIVVAFVPSRHGCEFGPRESGQGMQIQPIQRDCRIVEDNSSDDTLPREQVGVTFHGGDVRMSSLRE